MWGFFQWYVTTLPLDLFEWIAYPMGHSYLHSFTFYFLSG